MKNEWTKRIVCLLVGLVIFFYIAACCGCNQFGLRAGIELEGKKVSATEGAESRQAGIWGNLGR